MYTLSLDPEVLIVGAGIVGSAIGYRLAQAGTRVTVVEAKYPGAGTSGNSFAWLNSFSKGPQHYHTLNLRGIGEHRALAEEIGSHDCLHLDGALAWQHRNPALAGGEAARPNGGVLHVNYATKLQHVSLDHYVAQARHYGYRIDELTPAEAMKLEPDLVVDPSSVEVVYRATAEGWLEAAGLAYRLILEMTTQYGGAMIAGCAVVGFKRQGGSIQRVKLADGRDVGADIVINAAGPNSPDVAALAESWLPVGRSPGATFVTNSVPVRLRHVLHAPALGARPDSATRITLTEVATDPTLDPSAPFDTSDPRCENVLRAARSYLPGLAHARIESVRVGVRPIPQDELPIVGFDPNCPNLYHAVMHSGVTLAAIIGRLVTDDILGKPSPDLEPYRPQRFGAPGREEATHEALPH
jgi:glycine/D-amino acid oxidase-like deaminating enzyme